MERGKYTWHELTVIRPFFLLLVQRAFSHLLNASNFRFVLERNCIAFFSSGNLEAESENC